MTKYSLSPEVVDLIAFCTKNPLPMLPVAYHGDGMLTRSLTDSQQFNNKIIEALEPIRVRCFFAPGGADNWADNIVTLWQKW